MKLIHILFGILFSLSMYGQEVNYSYLSDKHFYDPTDLVGYIFKPSVLETTDGVSQELEPDEYSFGVSGSYLYVKGGDLTAAYNIGTINSTKYGFKLSLTNARDVLKTGHLKVILTGPGYVDALVFKASKDDEELIFVFPEKSDEIYQSDKEYYTDKWDSFVEHPDSIWGTKIYPYFEVSIENGNKHKRIGHTDSLNIAFVEEIKIIEKKKKIRKKKKKKKEFNIETGDIDEDEQDKDGQELTIEEETDISKEDNETQYKIKTKIIKSYYIVLRRVVQNDTGQNEIIEKKLKIKKWNEREDTSMKKGGDRFQISFITQKGEVFLYLTDQRKISAFEMNGTMYLMDGY